MGNLFRGSFGSGWTPSADSVKAPPDVLLRGDNLLLDELGVVAVRRGSAKINGSAFSDTSVDSLYSTLVSGVKKRYAGAGSHVYFEGAQLSPTFAGSGDISFSSWLSWVFMARSTSKHKHNGVSTTDKWGISTPTLAPEVEALPAEGKTFATCNTGESPAFTAKQGTITATFPQGEDGTANGSIEVTPNANGYATISKVYTSDQDFSKLVGGLEDEYDVFSMGVWLERPDEFEKVTLMVGLTTGTDPFKKDYYYFDFNFSPLDPSTLEVINQVDAEAAAARKARNTAPVSGKAASKDLDRAARRALRRANKQAKKRRSRERKDPATSDNDWGHYTVSRAQFNRVGGTTGRDWGTVTGIRLIYKAIKGSGGKIRYDNIEFSSGARALTGEYKLRYRWVADYGTFQEISPPSPVSAEIRVTAGSLMARIPSAAFAAKDPHVTGVWWYLDGGFLDQAYRCKEVVGVSPLNVSLWAGPDEFPYPVPGTGFSPESSLLTMPQLARMASIDLTYPQTTSSTPDFITLLDVNEIDTLITNEPISFEDPPPDNIVAVLGPYLERMAVLSQASGAQGFLYLSQPRRPSNFFQFHAFRVGDAVEVLHWGAALASSLYIGTSEDIYELTGSGGENPDGSLDLQIRGLGIGAPPISSDLVHEGNVLMYLAHDGKRVFTGADSQPVPKSSVELLYRGFTRHGVNPVDFTGRFRSALSHGRLYQITPESGGGQSIHLFDTLLNRWYRHTYPQTWRSIHREPDGTVVAGDNAGFVWTLDTGTADDAAAIPVVMWTKVDDDSDPLSRKDPFDSQIRLDTNGVNAAVAIHLDGSASPATGGSYNASATGEAVHKQDVSSIAAFRQAQYRITGSFNTFKLYDIDLAYRVRPHHRMAIDTGYLRTDRNDLAWVKEIRICANSPSNLIVTPSFDGVAGVVASPSTVLVTPNVTTVYTVKRGRTDFGYQPRIQITTAGSAGSTEVGFEVYWIELRFLPTGNVTQKPIKWMNPDMASDANQRGAL